MPHSALLLIALLAVTGLFVLLRVNAAMVFLSLCLGSILVQYVGTQANDLLKLITPRAGSLSASSVELGFLFVPAIITSIVTVFSLRGRLKALLNGVPALAAGALAVLLSVPLLTPGLRHTLETQSAWHYISNLQALIVGVGATISLLFLWAQRHSFKQRDKRHR